MASSALGQLTPPGPSLAETVVATHWFHSTGDCIERILRGLPLTPRCIFDGHGHVDPTFVHTGIPSAWRRKKTEVEERIEIKYRDWLEAQIKIFSGMEASVSISSTDPGKRLEIATEQLRYTLQCLSLTRQANSIFLSAMRSAGFEYLADILWDRLARFDHGLRKELWKHMQHRPRHMEIPKFLLEFDIESESASSAISSDFSATPQDQDQDEDDDCPICTCHVETIQAIVPPHRYLEQQQGVMVWQLVHWAHMGDVLSGPSAIDTGSTRLSRLLRQQCESFVTKGRKIRRRVCLYWTAFKTQSLLICNRTALLTRSLLSPNAWGALLTSFRAYRLQSPTRPIFRETIHVPQQVVFCGICKKRFHGECMSSWFASGGNNCPHCRAPMTRETFKAWLKLANTFCAVARRTKENEYQKALGEFRDF